MAKPQQLACWLGWAALSASGCGRDSTGAGDAKGSPSASASISTAAQTSVTASVTPARCKRTQPSAELVVRDTRKPEVHDAGDEEADLPFAVELGSAVGHKDGFVVGALTHEAQGSRALIAFVTATGTGRIVELGRAYGGADAPRVAVRGNDVVVVVSDSDAAGPMLRLASVRGRADKPEIRFGSELSQGRGSQSFAVEVAERRALVVWDGTERRRGVIRGATFDRADPATASDIILLSPKDRDAETPMLASRPAGFWLSFVGYEAETSRDDAVRRRASADAGEKLDELGRRTLYVMPLDEHATPLGAPMPVTESDAHVIAYDIAPLGDGGAVVAWRDDRLPGVEERTFSMARVRSSGAIERSVIEDDELGAGVAKLLPDLSATQPLPRIWLSVGGISDATRLAPLDRDAKLLGSLAPEPSLGNADALAAHAGKLLVARPDGRAVRLSVLACGDTSAAAKSSRPP